MTKALETPFPTFSVVTEWENVKLSDFDRARRMLKALATQLAELRPQFAARPEVIFLHDREAIDLEAVKAAVAEAFTDPDVAKLTFVATDGADYYQQKNIGVSLVDTELVVFLDSDVIPEPGWLAGLLTTFRDPSYDVVGGTTFLDLNRFSSRAFALFWFFPLEQGREGLRESRHFFANNVAFRREVIAQNPFPKLPSLRGACSILAQELMAKGHKIFINESSRVCHPPPNGVRHVLYRAMCQGHDDLVLGNLREPHKFRSAFSNALWRFQKRVRRAAKRIVLHRKEVGLGLVGTAGAAVLAVNYFLFYLVGLAISVVDRDYVPRRFPV
ncbi:MAG: glycosyltransferase [Planctomycetota bacterium]|nr:MAG: glycosyltransferase [Planctomycetota bacterium]